MIFLKLCLRIEEKIHTKASSLFVFFLKGVRGEWRLNVVLPGGPNEKLRGSLACGDCRIGGSCGFLFSEDWRKNNIERKVISN